jgi:hypothetical protein
MPLIRHVAFLIPRSTSQLLVVPLYEKPLLQIKFNANQGDRSLHIKQLPEIPKDLPPSAEVRELNEESEMERLAATYGVDNFRRAYPIDEAFTKAFESSQTVTLPSQDGHVPDMAKAPESLVDEFLELRVPNLDRAKATKLVEAGYQVLTISNNDIRAIAAVTGLSNNLLRATIEAAKSATPIPAPRGAPSAQSELRATSVDAPGLT